MYVIFNINLCSNCHTYVNTGSPLTCFYLSTGSTLTPQSKRPPDQPETAEFRHKAVQVLANGLATTTSATYAAGQKRFTAFVKPLMLPQSQLQNTPFCYLQHTWQLPTLLTPYQGLHLRHPAHACVSRTTHTI